MTCSWLTYSLPLSEYWYYALKRAFQVINYLPIKLRGQITMSFEIFHHVKPDIRTLFPMFSIAYADKHDNNATHQSNMMAQSIWVIIISTYSKANCIEFYHQPSNQIITRAIHKLDPPLQQVQSSTFVMMGFYYSIPIITK